MNKKLVYAALLFLCSIGDQTTAQTKEKFTLFKEFNFGLILEPKADSGFVTELTTGSYTVKIFTLNVWMKTDTCIAFIKANGGILAGDFGNFIFTDFLKNQGKLDVLPLNKKYVSFSRTIIADGSPFDSPASGWYGTSNYLICFIRKESE